MSNKQGLELVIEAARELGRTNSSARFVLCGDGPHRAKLQELSAGLANVQFLPLQPDNDLAELLNSADVHLIPQKAEATDLVLPRSLAAFLHQHGRRSSWLGPIRGSRSRWAVAASSPPAMQSLLRTLYARWPSIECFAGNWAIAPARSP